MKVKSDRPMFRAVAGFTLVEVIVAIGIFATVAVSIVALVALGTDSVAENSDRSAAYRLVGALEQKLSAGGFKSVYESLRDDPEADFFLYTYAGHPTDMRDDGTAAPTAANGGAARDFRVETGFRADGDAFLEEDLVASLGSVFRVKLAVLPPEVGVDAADYELPEMNSYRHGALRLNSKFYVEPAADVAGDRPLESLPEALDYPLTIPR